MTLEAMVVNRHDTSAERNEETELRPEDAARFSTRSIAFIIGIGGANADHMGNALNDVWAHGSDLHHPSFIPKEELGHRANLLNTPEGRKGVEQFIEDRDEWIVYVSLTPELHISVALEYLAKVTKPGQFVVLPKPAVRDTKEMGVLDRALEATHARLLKADPAYSQEANPILLVHEHYPEKGSWKALCEKLPEIAGTLGRLESVTITIQEEQSVESERRTKAFAGGALEDLEPHLGTIAFQTQDGINAGGLYDISDRSEMSLRRFRYTDSKLTDENTETGFIINGMTKITDKRKKETHDLVFKLQGGKGLVKEKKVSLSFVHPETDEVSTVVVDFGANEISELPDKVKHLFLQTKYEDNGYGEVIRAGLMPGGSPRESFQSWEDARRITKMIELLRRQITGKPESYMRPLTENGADGISLETLALAA